MGGGFPLLPIIAGVAVGLVALLINAPKYVAIILTAMRDFAAAQTIDQGERNG